MLRNYNNIFVVLHFFRFFIEHSQVNLSVKIEFNFVSQSQSVRYLCKCMREYLLHRLLSFFLSFSGDENQHTQNANVN